MVPSYPSICLIPVTPSIFELSMPVELSNVTDTTPLARSVAGIPPEGFE